MPSERRIVVSQNTGSPVLDSLVNLMAGGDMPIIGKNLESTHAVLLRLAEQEPGGLES